MLNNAVRRVACFFSSWQSEFAVVWNRNDHLLTPLWISMYDTVTVHFTLLSGAWRQCSEHRECCAIYSVLHWRFCLRMEVLSAWNIQILWSRKHWVQSRLLLWKIVALPDVDWTLWILRLQSWHLANWSSCQVCLVFVNISSLGDKNKQYLFNSAYE